MQGYKEARSASLDDVPMDEILWNFGASHDWHTPANNISGAAQIGAIGP